MKNCPNSPRKTKNSKLADRRTRRRPTNGEMRAHSKQYEAPTKGIEKLAREQKNEKKKKKKKKRRKRRKIYKKTFFILAEKICEKRELTFGSQAEKNETLT